MSIIKVLSDIVMFFSAAGLISTFGISKYREKKYLFIAAGLNLFLAVVVSVLNELRLSAVSMAVYLMMFLTAFRIVFGETKLSHIYIALISDYVTSLLSSCIYVLIGGSIPLGRFDTKMITLLFFRLSLLAAVAALNRSGKLRKLYLTIKIIPNHIFILIALSVMFISLLAENNSLSVEDYLKQMINTVCIAALTIVLIVMIFSLLINVVAKKQYSDDNDLLRRQVDTQLRHYNKLEKLNGDIRAFRHDYTNHIRSILSLLEMEQYGDAEEYTKKLISTSPTENYSFQTGNQLADAILADKNDLCGESAKVVFYGFIPDRIDNTDLCVILSNALDNAVEACRSCEGQNQIEVYAQERQGYFALTVRNPTLDARTYRNIPDTCKADVLNHGFGLRNIETVVKKHDGCLSIKCENMVFELSLTFKL